MGEGSTALRCTRALRGQERMPSSLGMAGKGEMSLEHPHSSETIGLGFHSLLFIRQ